MLKHNLRGWDDRLLGLLTPQHLWSLSPVWRYGLAVVIVSAATLLRWALLPWMGTTVPYNAALVAMVCTTVLLGPGPGLLSVLLGDVAVEVFVMGSLPTMFAAATLLRLGVSVAIGVFVVWVFHSIRAAAIKAQQSEARLAAFAEATFEGIVESQAGRIVDCNEQFAQMIGCTPARLRGTAIADLIVPEDRERVLANISANRESVTEHTMFRRDGTRLMVEAHGRPQLYDSARRQTVIRNITDRKGAEERLTADLAALRRMHDLSAQVPGADGLQPLLQEVMEAAVAIVAAEKGTLQLLEGDGLRIAAHHGHQPPFLEFFAAAENRASVCGEAMQRGQRVVVPDIEASPLFAGTPSLAVLRAAGVRAVQSTPMVSRTGALLGILTTHWPTPYSPDEHDLWRIDLLARQAADLIEAARAEQALQAQRQLLETVVGHIPASLALIRGSDLRLQFVNPAYQAIAPGKEMTGRTLDEVWPETGQDFSALCRRVLETGEPHQVEDELNMVRREPDGPLEEAYFSWSLHRVRLPGDEGWGILNAAWETTARKCGEQALRESEERFRVAQQLAPDSFSILRPERDADGRVVDFTWIYANPTLERFVGMPFAALAGRRLLELFPGHRGSPLLSAYQRVAETGQTCVEEARYEGDGVLADRWFRVAVVSMGADIAVLAQDITDRKESEAALRESHERLKKVLEVETVGVMFWDLATGCMTDANDTFLKMMGYSRREVEARELTWQKLTPPEYMEVSLAEIRKFQATGRVGPYEKEYFCKDGTRQWLLFAGSSLGGNACVEFCVDIADRKKSEEGLHHAAAELQAANATLQESRRAALNLMDDALAARRQAEETSAKLLDEMTVRQQAEEALARERANLQTVFDVVNVGLLVIDEHGVVKRVNDTVPRWVGKDLSTSVAVQPGDLLGCVHALADSAGCGKAPHCGDCLIRQAFESVLRTGQPVHDVEAEATLALDGREVRLWLEVSADPLVLDGRPHVLLAMNNITARKQAEAEVVRLATFPRLNPNPLCEVDGEGQVHFVNPTAERLFPDLRERETAHPWLADWPSVVRTVLESPEKRTARDVAVGERWYHQLIHFVEQVGRIRIYGLDITERRRGEEERKIAVEFLQLVNESTEVCDLIRAATAFFQQHAGCDAVGIRLKDGDDYPYFEARGFPAEFVQLENRLCARSDHGELVRDGSGDPVIECMCGNVICGRFDPAKPFFTGRGSFWTNCTTELLASTTEADRQARTRNRCNGAGYESVALLPLRVGEQRLGLVQLNDRRRGRFTPEGIALWERLAGHLAVALANLQAEEALREGAERLSRAQEIAHLGSWELDVVNHRLSWSDEVYRIFGLRPQEFAATYEAFLEAVHPEDRIAVDAAYHDSLREDGQGYEIEHRVVRPSTGEVRVVHERCQHLRDQAGRVIRSLGMVQDITERKHWEAVLQDSVARFALLAQSAETLLQTDEPQQVVEELCREVMEHVDCHVFFNFLVDEGAGRLHLNACAGIPPEEARRIEWLDYGTAVCGCAARDACRIVAEHIPSTPDPRTELVKSYGVRAYACHPILGPGGKVLGTLSFGTRGRETFSEDDLSLMKVVTDHVAAAMIRKQAEERVRQSVEELARSNEDLQQFAYVASHDLQEPLRMVSGFVQLLQKKYAGRLDTEADEFIAYAVDGAKRMETLIRDLLSYSRVGSRGRELVPTDAGLALRRALGNLAVSIEETGAEITSGELPTVMADGSQLAQVFQNLVGNALKFRSSEAPRIRVEAHRNADHWLFSIHDNGIGIEPEYQDRIFLIFQRLHSRRQYAGTGIGLAICKKIVDRHGGQIWVESQAGQGATFYFTLPA